MCYNKCIKRKQIRSDLLASTLDHYRCQSCHLLRILPKETSGEQETLELECQFCDNTETFEKEPGYMDYDPKNYINRRFTITNN